MSEELESVTPPEEGQEPQPEEVEEPVVEEEADDTTALQEKLDKEVEARRHLTARAKKAEADRSILEAKLRAAKKPTLDVDDYIDISKSLQGLDQEEQEFIAEQHKLTGKPLVELRNSKNFLLWREGHIAEVEKERTLAPSNKQSEADRPKSLLDKLKGASIEEKEKILSERGLYRTVRPRVDRQFIGGK